MNKNTIVTILAIIGAVVVAGWALKLTFKLIGLLIVLAVGAVIVLSAQKLIGGQK